MTDIATTDTAMPEGIAGLRILVAGFSWPPETFILNLFRRLAEAGAQITVATAQPADNLVERIVLPDVRLSRRDSLTSLWRCARIAARHRPLLGELWRAAGERLSGADRVYRMLLLLAHLGGEFDVVYLPWLRGAGVLLPVFDELPPVVVSCRGAQLSVAIWHPEGGEILRRDLAQVFEHAAGVHCVSEAILAEAVEVGLDPARATVVRPGANTERFYPPPGGRIARSDGAPLRVVTVGSLGWRKGFEYLLLAVRELVDGGTPLVVEVIGEGRDRARLALAVAELGLEESVHLVGRCAPDEIRERLWAADAFVLPSLSEGISNAVLEAMATALPVVTTDCGGMSEVVTDGVEGYLVPVRDPGALAGALHRLADDPVGAVAMGEAGRARVLAGLTAADNAAGLAEVLVRAAGRSTDRAVGGPQGGPR